MNCFRASCMTIYRAMWVSRYGPRLSRCEGVWACGPRRTVATSSSLVGWSKAAKSTLLLLWLDRVEEDVEAVAKLEKKQVILGSHFVHIRDINCYHNKGLCGNSSDSGSSKSGGIPEKWDGKRLISDCVDLKINCGCFLEVRKKCVFVQYCNFWEKFFRVIRLFSIDWWVLKHFLYILNVFPCLLFQDLSFALRCLATHECNCNDEICCNYFS